MSYYPIRTMDHSRSYMKLPNSSCQSIDITSPIQRRKSGVSVSLIISPSSRTSKNNNNNRNNNKYRNNNNNNNRDENIYIQDSKVNSTSGYCPPRKNTSTILSDTSILSLRPHLIRARSPDDSHRAISYVPSSSSAVPCDEYSGSVCGDSTRYNNNNINNNNSDINGDNSNNNRDDEIAFNNNNNINSQSVSLGHQPPPSLSEDEKRWVSQERDLYREEEDRNNRRMANEKANIDTLRGLVSYRIDVAMRNNRPLEWRRYNNNSSGCNNNNSNNNPRSAMSSSVSSRIPTAGECILKEFVYNNSNDNNKLHTTSSLSSVTDKPNTTLPIYIAKKLTTDININEAVDSVMRRELALLTTQIDALNDESVTLYNEEESAIVHLSRSQELKRIIDDKTGDLIKSISAVRSIVNVNVINSLSTASSGVDGQGLSAAGPLSIPFSSCDKGDVIKEVNVMNISTPSELAVSDNITSQEKLAAPIVHVSGHGTPQPGHNSVTVLSYNRSILKAIHDSEMGHVTCEYDSGSNACIMDMPSRDRGYDIEEDNNNNKKLLGTSTDGQEDKFQTINNDNSTTSLRRTMLNAGQIEELTLNSTENESMRSTEAIALQLRIATRKYTDNYNLDNDRLSLQWTIIKAANHTIAQRYIELAGLVSRLSVVRRLKALLDRDLSDCRDRSAVEEA